MGVQDRSARDRDITTRSVATLVAATSMVVAAFPALAWAECSLENVASPQEIAEGWTIHEDRRVVKQVDSAPREQGGRGNWVVDRETTTLPLCSVFDDLGAYSLRSYMLPPIVTKLQARICQATAGGGSVPFVPAEARTRPADTPHEVYDAYKRPYPGPCPPARAPLPRSR